MNLDPDFESYFIKADPIIDKNFIENDTIFIKCEETYDNIFYKTIESFKLFKDKINEYDYIFRTNLSSVVDLNKLLVYERFL